MMKLLCFFFLFFCFCSFLDIILTAVRLWLKSRKEKKTLSVDVCEIMDEE